jgi:glutathione peroxidase
MKPLLTSFFIFVTIMALSGIVYSQAHAEGGTAVSDRTVYEFSADSIDGEKVPLEKYRGKVLLIVNTASKCGFTPQYEKLKVLYGKYHGKGFEVLAFPANNFMNQEPGTNQAIKEFCSLNYGIQFPLFAKISVKGKDIHPLYQYLTKESEFPGAISWNFNKFLIDQKGHVAARYGSRTDPLDKEVTEKIESLLSAG